MTASVSTGSGAESSRLDGRTGIVSGVELAADAGISAAALAGRGACALAGPLELTGLVALFVVPVLLFITLV